MSGQVSAVWSMFNTVPSILAPLAGGWLSDKLDRLGDAQAARVLFGAGGAVSLLLLLYAALRPASVYGNVALEHEAAIDPWADLEFRPVPTRLHCFEPIRYAGPHHSEVAPLRTDL